MASFVQISRYFAKRLESLIHERHNLSVDVVQGMIGDGLRLLPDDYIHVCISMCYHTWRLYPCMYQHVLPYLTTISMYVSVWAKKMWLSSPTITMPFDQPRILFIHIPCLPERSEHAVWCTCARCPWPRAFCAATHVVGPPCIHPDAPQCQRLAAAGV